MRTKLPLPQTAWRSPANTAEPAGAAKIVRTWNGIGITAVGAERRGDVALVNGFRRAGLHCPAHLAVIDVDATPLVSFSIATPRTVAFDRMAIVAAVSAVLVEQGFRDEALPAARDVATLIVRQSASVLLSA